MSVEDAATSVEDAATMATHVFTRAEARGVVLQENTDADDLDNAAGGAARKAAHAGITKAAHANDTLISLVC